MSGDALRLDRWLWYARFYKSRTLAAKVCESGRVRVNAVLVAKAHYLVREGDVLTFVWHGRVKVLQIVALGSRRGPASEARGLYVDVSAGGEGGPDPRVPV
jgi:ribosome-associated heat shock protein Hsp15